MIKMQHLPKKRRVLRCKQEGGGVLDPFLGRDPRQQRMRLDLYTPIDYCDAWACRAHANVDRRSKYKCTAS